MSRILTLQRQARELGRLRTGTFDGRRPVRSDTWVISSHSEEYIEAAAAVWGGKPEKWQPQGNGAQQYRVITTSTTVDAILPPGDPLSQAYEMWNRGGCARRCDGITELLSDNPCLCRAQFGEDFHEQRAGTVCNMTTRLNVMLPAMPDIGVWRAETHSFYAANELAGHVDTIRGLVGQQTMVPVRLRIEQRTRVAGGQTKHFPVIALELRGVTAGQVLAIGGGSGETSGLVSLAGGAKPLELTAAAPSEPAPDYVRAARAAYSLEQVQEIWKRAEAAGHLTEELKAQLVPIGNALANQPKDAPQTPAAPVDADPEKLWMQVVMECPQGWTTAQLETDFTEFTGGVAPENATAADMAGYLQQLKAGAR
jgi:hypothetical protein